MAKPDRLALLICLAAIIAAAFVAETIFEAVPHLEDEVAYDWQAKVLAHGALAIASPPHPKSTLVPFVVDYNGLRFGKYPPGWPAMLSVGIRLGLRMWVNPLLAGLGVGLTYLLGKRLFSPTVGLLAAGLTVTSPFFLMNSGSLLSHPFGLVLSLGFVLGWLGLAAPVFGTPRPARPWVFAWLAALSLGLLALTRPWSAAAVALPFAFHGLYLLWRGDWDVRRRLLAFGLLTLALSSLLFAWQYTLTGDARLNPYTLWWPYDKVGFGPGFGVKEQGHTLRQALFNTRNSLSSGAYDLFGWGPLSWIFLPFGVWAARRQRAALMVGGVFVSLAAAYMAYWIGSELYGPRYYYEGLFSLTLLSAAGMAWLAGPPSRQPFPARLTWGGLDRARRRRWLVTALCAGLVMINLAGYLPLRLQSMTHLYTITRSAQAPFLSPEAQALTPALIIVHSDQWMFYGSLLELQDPWQSTPFVFAWNINPEIDASLAADFPGRKVYHYYQGEPYRFYTRPKP